MKRIGLLILLTMVTVIGALAQVTTSEINGVVSGGKETLIGATIQAVHQPSGSSYGTVTNSQGRYLIQGMRTGGPYKITVSFVGYQTTVYNDIYLKLGETLNLNVVLNETNNVINEVVVSGIKTKFTTEKTGAVTNISNNQLTALPSINRSLSDFTRLSPYAGADNSFGGRDGRTNTFTIDGANLNNNFGLSSSLPGGGNPISLDAIEEVQVVIAPFDVRQTNFVGGGINAITKSGTNTFKGSAYTFFRNQDYRGNKVDGYDLGTRSTESSKTYGFTLGGPIIKNKLFFFLNGEYQDQPQPITKWKASTDGISNADAMISRTTVADLDAFSTALKDKYGYNAGSYSNYDGGNTNKKFLARLDWNISQAHKLSIRYNLTKNEQDIATNGTSTVGTKASSNRISQNALAFRNNCYSMNNNVWSLTAELNSRFGEKVQNRFLATYADIKDERGSLSSPFPHIDIWKDGDAYMSAGYELFSWNNLVQNKTLTIQDNVTITLGNHKIIAGESVEYQSAVNNFMRYGTGYYKYASLADFISGAAPTAFGLTYGYNGEAKPASEVDFMQSGVYAQDEWSISKNLKVTYGIRAEVLTFLNDLQTNEAFKAVNWKDHFIAKTDANYGTYTSPVIDNGKWPESSVMFSPRVGFNWNVLGDNKVTLRGGSGIFTGRIPLVFFTNMPTNGMMLQNTVQITDAPTLAKLKGGPITDVNKMISTLGLPTTPIYSDPAASIKGSSIVGVDKNFKMPQVWKTSLAVDYQLPTSFPMSVTLEGMYNKDINAVVQENWNVINEGNLTKFSGPDTRYNYRSVTSPLVNTNVTSGAIVLTNTKKGYSSSFNVMVNAEPISKLNLSASYTHMVAQEISGLPGSQAYSSWQNQFSIDSPNLAGMHSSQYVTPNKVIASASYKYEYGKGRNFATTVGVYYAGYNAGTFTYYYSNDMNGDKESYDLLYVPKTQSELTFVDQKDSKGNLLFTAAQQSEAFWKFVNQDSYLKDRKGKYTEAYGAKMPWLNRVDVKIAQDFKVKFAGQMHAIQLSVDILNFGNMINNSWGVTSTTAPSNYGKILTYSSTVNGVPTFTMPYITNTDGTKSLISKSFDSYKVTSNCWWLQFGIRYTFN